MKQVSYLEVVDAHERCYGQNCDHEAQQDQLLERLSSLQLRAELPDEEPLSALAPVLRTQLADQGHDSFICVTFEYELPAFVILEL